MAAKPPKPPGNFLKNLFSHSHSNSNNNREEISEILRNKETQITKEERTAKNLNTNEYCNNTADVLPTKTANCNCTNITIMHLFHEMKQEFPTIPDTIVTQCVNENCHQRENCIQMLRNELELNPIPVQSYPAKVLHPTNYNNNNNNQNNNKLNNSSIHQNSGTHLVTSISSPQKPPLQQKPLFPVQQKPSLKPPLKPVRPAPLQPPATNVHIANTAKSSPVLQKKISSGNLSVDGLNLEGHIINENLNDMPSTNIQQVPPQQQQEQQQPLHSINSTQPDKEKLNFSHNNNNNEESGSWLLFPSVGETKTNNVDAGKLPRPVRPTTLNLNTPQQQQQQQQKQQRLNVQLQEHFQQQRRQQQTQNTKQQQQQPTNNKPLRKAPLPPIAPKPIVFHHSNNNNNHHVASATETCAVVVSPQSDSEISVNLTLSTPSPTSSTTSSASLTTSTKTHHTQHLQNKSPIRHRSVITLQPEPPYARDFLVSQQTPATAIQTTTSSTPTSNSTCIVSSPTNSAHSGTSQKSYTSVNLTLRPPTTVLNSALQPSAIDITAGPGFSGASGGGKSLSYSSTSYDARLGYQQNFHITVTDEGGVFSASRRRPQQQQQRNINQVNICKNEYDDNTDDDKGNNVNSLYAEQQQILQQQKQQQQQQQQQLQHLHQNSEGVALRSSTQQYQQQQQQHNNQYISAQGINCSSGFGSMCLAPQQAEEDAFVTETLERQKKRRDRLAGALRENKKRLSQVEQEVNLITGPIPEGLSERLDIDIQKLRAECQAMLRSSNPLAQQQRPQQQQSTHQQQFPPQPFPRQRAARPPPRPPPNATTTAMTTTTMPRQTSLDIIQHHTTSTPCTPHTPASLPNYLNSTPQSPTPHQQHMQHSAQSLTPSIYQQQGLAYNQTPLMTNYISGMADEDPPSYYIDQDETGYDDEIGDDDDDDEYEVVEHWECSMCTFRNHPQLNICECCDNVRILPGTLTNLSRALSANAATSTSALAAAAASSSLAPLSRSASAVAGLTTVTNATSVTDVNAAGAAATSVPNLNALNPNTGNLEHDTSSAAALAQQQLQHLALHT